MTGYRRAICSFFFAIWRLSNFLFIFFCFYFWFFFDIFFFFISSEWWERMKSILYILYIFVRFLYKAQVFVVLHGLHGHPFLWWMALTHLAYMTRTFENTTHATHPNYIESLNIRLTMRDLVQRHIDNERVNFANIDENVDRMNKSIATTTTTNTIILITFYS